MRLETWTAPPGDRIPNNPCFPVLIYHGVDAAAAGAHAARRLFAQHGWGGGSEVGSTPVWLTPLPRAVTTGRNVP